MRTSPHTNFLRAILLAPLAIMSAVPGSMAQGTVQTSKVKDPKAIEKVARERYGMVKEGETVYRVKREK